MQDYNDDSVFTDCETGDHPDSIVKLRKCCKIVSRMFEEEQPKFYWIVQSHSEYIQNQVERVRKLADSEINYMRTAAQFVNRFRQQTNYDQPVTLIIMPSLVLEIKQIANSYQVHNIIVCCYESIFMLEEDIRKLSHLINRTLITARSQQELVNLIQALRNSRYDFKQLPTFQSFDENQSNDSNASQTFLEILSQKVNQQGRQNLVQRLKGLFEEIMQVSDYFYLCESIILDFLKELREGPLTTTRAIYWYTYQSPIFKLTNNLLRMSREDSQIFYIQPYLKDLMEAVHSLYRKQLEGNSYRSFVCFRGGMISFNELQYFKNSINRVVQNLGFLSTSLKKQTALEYVHNVLFQIFVQRTEHRASDGQGYAFIAEQSYYFSEQEVLFNPLNSFRVCDVKKKLLNKKTINEIKLLYVELKPLNLVQVETK